MNITISKSTSNSKKSRSNLQKRFDKLLSEVKNKQKANEKLKLDLNNLYKIYQDQILPVEQLTITPFSELAERLIGFFGRKSLAKWQREELSQWIMECIEHVDAIDPKASETLFQSYRQEIANFLDVDLEELEKQSKEAEECLDKIFEDNEDPFENMKNSTTSEEFGYQEDLFGFSEFENQDEQESTNQSDFNNFEDFFQEETMKGKPQNSDRFSDKWLRDIFRRAANALHPDKEIDGKLKLEKEQLMSQLLTARDQNDVFSLLNIYMQYVDGDELQVAKETMENLCEQLRFQKKSLNEEKFEIIYENPIYYLIYENFYSKSKKTQDKKIKRHLKQVNDSIIELSQFAANIRNLKILKGHLENRYDEFQFMNSNRSQMDQFYY